MKFRRPEMNWLVLCISALIFFSVAVGKYDAFHSSIDFVNVYTGARCMFHGCSPYDSSQLERQYFQGGGDANEQPAWNGEIPIYPPSTFLALSPLALLPFPVARVIWLMLNGCLFATSAGLILSLCPQSHRWLGTLVASLIVATSGVLLALGNPAIFAISSLIIGSYLFLRDRFLPLGACLLALSLAVKPPIGGLIVLYMLATEIRRRYAVAAVAGALALLISAGLILRMHPSSAGWASALDANISTTLKAGGVSDPRPANENAVVTVNLQGITSVFSADAQEFNIAAYAIFLVLLAVFIAAILRAKANLEMHLLSFGALATLSLTPVYHRFYDTRLLLITIPAVVIVYRHRRLLGALIGTLTVLAVISVQARVQQYLLHHSMWQSILQNKFLFILLLRQQNLELLLLFCLYMFAIFTIRFPSSPEMECSSRNPREAFSQ
ncbi:MAG: glycosyltransferase 87 family protein [Terracidiphilus sp.]